MAKGATARRGRRATPKPGEEGEGMIQTAKKRHRKRRGTQGRNPGAKSNGKFNLMVPKEDTEYFLCLKPGTPYASISAGGLNFQKVTEKVSQDEDGETVRDRKSGLIHSVTPEQVHKVLDYCRNNVIRWNKGGTYGRIYSRIGRKFKATNRDVPVGKYLIMVPIKEDMPVRFRNPKTAPTVQS
jgi:hypothetical protein